MKAKTLAIPIRATDYSETSQIVSVFTREHGVVEGIAKGVYREKSSFQGPFDLGVLYQIVFVGRRDGGLSVLTESAVIDGFRGIRRLWGRYAAACHVLELLRASSTPWSPEPRLFDLAVDTLLETERSEGSRLALVVARYDLLALRILGLLGPVEGCVECGLPWPGGRRSGFLSPEAGGLVCRECRASSGAAGVGLPAAAVRALVALSGFETPIEEVEASWDECAAVVHRAVSGLRDHLLDRRMVALRTARRRR